MADSIQQQFGLEAELIKGSNGVFEVQLGDELVFSKRSTGRFPDEGEVEKDLESRLS